MRTQWQKYWWCLFFIFLLFAICVWLKQQIFDGLNQHESHAISWQFPHTLILYDKNIRLNQDMHLHCPVITLTLNPLSLLQGKIEAKNITLNSPTLDLSKAKTKKWPTVNLPYMPSRTIIPLQIHNGVIFTTHGQITQLQAKATLDTFKKRVKTLRIKGYFQRPLPLAPIAFKIYADQITWGKSGWLANNTSLNFTLPSGQTVQGLSAIRTDPSFTYWYLDSLRIEQNNLMLLGQMTLGPTFYPQAGTLAIHTTNFRKFLNGWHVNWPTRNPNTLQILQGHIAWDKQQADIRLDGHNIHVTWQPNPYIQINHLNAHDYWPMHQSASVLLNHHFWHTAKQWKIFANHLKLPFLDIDNALIHIKPTSKKTKITLESANNPSLFLKLSAGEDKIDFSLQHADIDAKHACDHFSMLCGLASPLTGDLKGYINQHQELYATGHLAWQMNQPIQPSWLRALHIDTTWHKTLKSQPTQQVDTTFTLAPQKLTIDSFYLSAAEHSCQGRAQLDRINNTLKAKGQCFSHTHSLKHAPFNLPTTPLTSYDTKQPNT